MRYSRVRRNRRRYLILFIGIFLFFFGIIFLIVKNYHLSKLQDLEDKSINNYFDKQDIEIKEEIQPSSDNNDEDELYDYESIIEIPKINLRKGLFKKTSINNNVDRNIYVLAESTYPDDGEFSHILLASHSGNSYVSFFRDINNLIIGDHIYIYHNGIKYIYKVSNKYEINKTGKASIGLYKKSMISLITCIDGTNKQLVIVGELIKEEQ